MTALGIFITNGDFGIKLSLENEWIILFTGELQESADLLHWNTISNATNGVYKLDFKQTKKFYRSTR